MPVCHHPATPLRLLVLAAALVLAGAEASRAERIAVIVHRDRGELALEPEAIAQIYLKQRAFWPGGDAIVPINREAGSRVRDLFSRNVLGRGASRLRTYWNRRYFQGVLPPATLASDEAVLRFVAGEPRAIGYVLSESVNDSVRAVFVFDAR